MERRMKVLIVDDELPIRDELRLMNLEEYGYEIVGEAANGKTALQLCRELEPEIVVTDITMPVMDGIELIENLQKTMPLTKYILLTCHQDFLYAKQAIEHDAVDYILKADISREGIVKVLDKARDALERERKQLKKLESEKRNRFSGYAVSNIYDEKNIGAELEKIDFQINHNGPNFFLMVENHLGSWIFVEMLVRGFLDASGMIRSWILLNDGLYGLSMRDGADMEVLVSQVREEIRNVFPYIDKWFRIYAIESGVRILSGKQYMESKALSEKWKAEAFYNPERDYFRDMKIKEFSCFVPEYTELLEMLFQDAGDTWEEVREKIRKWCCEIHLWPEELRKLILLFLRKRGKEDDNNIRDASDICQLTTVLVNQCYSEIHFAGRSEVRKTIRIIQKEYQRDLTLFEIADRIGINSQYLGRLFLEETQEKFSDYLNRVRMERASELLKEGELKIYEVAERVGITNYRYFTQKFREWSGVSPKEIRRGGKRYDG